MAGGNQNGMQGNDYDDGTKDNYKYNTNYYNYAERASFDGYHVTTTNPGTLLLFITAVSCIICFVIGIYAASWISRRNLNIYENDEEDGGTECARHTDSDLKAIEAVSELPLPKAIIVKTMDTSKIQRKSILLKVKQGSARAIKNIYESSNGKPLKGQHRPGKACVLIDKGRAATVASPGTARVQIDLGRAGDSKFIQRPQTAKVTVKGGNVNNLLQQRPQTTTVLLEKTRKGRGKRRYTSESLRNLASMNANRSRSACFDSPAVFRDEKLVTEDEKASRPQNTRPQSADTFNTRPSTADSNKLAFEDFAMFLFSKNEANSSTNEYILDDISLDDNSLSTASTYSTFIGDETMWIELQKIFKYAAPWFLQSIISYGASLLSIIMISHFMGLRAMLCYSYVWYITDLTHIPLDAWYNAIYKHMNNACSLETAEGYHSAGHLTRIGIIGTVMLSIPLGLLTVVFMPSAMRLFGYEGAIVILSQEYAMVVVLNNLLTSVSEVMYIILDLEGYAKFTAIFEFWESGASLLAELFFIVVFSPSLLSLGIFHLTLEIASTATYFTIVWRNGWLNGYIGGLTSPVESWWNQQMKSVVLMSIPLLSDEIIYNIEGLVLTIFAAYQGSAETAVWVLINYIWDFAELIPYCFADAVAVRVVRHLSKSRVEFAQRLSIYSIKVGILISVACSVVLFIGGNFFVWCITLDETLRQMLLEIIPYIVICQPFVSIGVVVWALLSSLHIYVQGAYVAAAITILFTIPYSAMMTYYFNYNIEGLASAMCIGYTATGIAALSMFINADWDRAVRKAQIV